MPRKRKRREEYNPGWIYSGFAHVPSDGHYWYLQYQGKDGTLDVDGPYQNNKMAKFAMNYYATEYKRYYPERDKFSLLAEKK